MKKFVYLFLLCLFLAAPYFVVHADIATGLALWWRFDEGSGSTVVDSSGNGNTGIASNAPAYISGKMQTALSFNGSSQYVSTSTLANIPALNGAQTLSAWINSNSTTATQDIITFANAASPTSATQLRISGQTLQVSQWGGAVVETSSFIIPINSWHFVAFTFDGTYSTLYVDGAQVAQNTSVPQTASAGAVFIGEYPSGEWFSGGIDDVRIYNRALSASDIAQLYAFNPPTWALTSKSFFVHSVVSPIAGGNATSSFSTSADFKMVGVGSENGIGTSTSADFGVQGGFMRNAYKTPAPVYDQVHYHWRNDDGSETGATSATGGAQDTALSSISTGATKRIRFGLANHGGTILGYVAQQFKIQFGVKATTCSAISSWNALGSSAAWNISTTANLTDGANTTNVAISAGGVADSNHTFLTTNGGVKDTGDTTASISVPSDSFLDLEYAVTPTSFASNGAVYCFRLTNASSTANFLYTKYPEATVSATSLTVVLDSGSQTFPALTPGGSVSTSSVLSIYTNNASGFNANVNRNNALATLLSTGSSTLSIPDMTSWSPGATCGTAGNAAASTSAASTLKFRVQQTGSDSGNYCSAWWGSNDGANALFSGLPSTAKQIINRSTSSTPTTTAQILYSIGVPATQQTGSYTGSVTYTVTANP